MAMIDFRFQFLVVCLLSSIVTRTSTVEDPIKSVDQWSLPDAQAFVGKLFRYRVTSDRPCAAHYKVYSMHSLILLLRFLRRTISDLFFDYLNSSIYYFLSFCIFN